MRTFVVSDAHGSPEIILDALGHGGFAMGRDAFVYAGDLLDRGPRAKECVALAERYATEVLFGNHDAAALFGLPVWPQNPESRRFRGLLRRKALREGWKLATAVEGVLITHAGISESYNDLFADECNSDPIRFAAYLNARFRALVERRPPIRDWYDDALLGDDGPLWFRPAPYSSHVPLGGCPQVAGHTLPLAFMEGSSFYMIDPTSVDRVEAAGRYRYAVIEGGAVRVEDGCLEGPAGAPTVRRAC
jgi:hypothetical protein